MNGEFPFPQTLGRQRDLNTVLADPNTGQVARPTQYEAQSLFTQVGSYINNWLGNTSTANQVKDAQSFDKAQKVSTGPAGTFPTIVDTWGETSPFKTMADEFLDRLGLKVSSVEPGSEVAGRPVAPTTTNYQYANNIDKSIKDLRYAGEAFAEQVKGMFNIAYKGPTEETAVPLPSGPIFSVRSVDPMKAAAIVLIGLLILG